MASHRTFALLALALTGCSQGRLDVVGLAPDMVAHWPCDEGSDSKLLDHSINKYDGTIDGATWIPDGRFGGALHFNSGNSVFVPSFPQATKSWSLSLWVRPSAWAFPADSGINYYITLISTEIAFMSGWEMNAHLPPAQPPNNYRAWEYHFAYPKGGDAGGNPYKYYDCDCVDANQWTHLVAVVDSAAMQMSFYKNGELQGAQAITDLIQPQVTGYSPLYMGTWSLGGRNFVGDLDDIVIYGRALTAAEVASLYTQPAPSVPR
jgi:hypothetical protein